MTTGFRAWAVLWLVTTSCTSVDVVRLSGQTFPPKSSRAEVALLDREPKCPHLRLAELRVDDSTDKFETMQRQILDRAASLGADAVLFEKPEKHIQHQVTYAPAYTYSPWGYGAYAYPGWGYGGGWYGYGPYGYGGGMAMPYDYTVRSLTGLAIRYTNSPGSTCSD